MQCPKCKSYISDNSLRCPNCNLKVRIVCPKCKTINLMGKKECKNCGYEIFIKCPTCSAVNLSESDYCRKCGDILKPIEKENIIREEIKSKTKQNTQEIKLQSNIEEIAIDKITEKTTSAENNEQIYENNLSFPKRFPNLTNPGLQEFSSTCKKVCNP